jgi:hypothetical protein
VILGDWNSRIGTRQVDLPHNFDKIDNWDSNSHNLYETRRNKDTTCSAEGIKLAEFVIIMVFKS